MLNVVKIHNNARGKGSYTHTNDDIMAPSF